jgi:predicted nucleic acid-binding protein
MKLLDTAVLIDIDRGGDETAVLTPNTDHFERMRGVQVRDREEY